MRKYEKILNYGGYVYIIILATVLVWGATIRELSKPTRKQKNRKIVTLVALGSLLTLATIIPFF